MKKLLFVMLVLVVGASAQTITNQGSYGTREVHLAILTWSPFTSDSLATAYSDAFDLTGVDSIQFTNYSVSTNGTAKYLGVIQISADPSIGYDSVGVAADTTNVKLEAMEYIGNVPVPSVAKGRIKVVGNAYAAASATQNRKDTQVNIYMTLFRRVKQ